MIKRTLFGTNYDSKKRSNSNSFNIKQFRERISTQLRSTSKNFRSSYKSGISSISKPI